MEFMTEPIPTWALCYLILSRNLDKTSYHDFYIIITYIDILLIN